VGRKGVISRSYDFYLASPHVEEGGARGRYLVVPTGWLEALARWAEFLNTKKALSSIPCSRTVKGVYMNECVINKVNYRYIAVTFASRLIIMFFVNLHDCGGIFIDSI
jgi:hypothetical protein